MTPAPVRKSWAEQNDNTSEGTPGATIDLLIVLAFVAYAIGSGLRARHKASQKLQEYFLAGKTLPGWKAGFSMAATQFAADTPLLVTGLVAGVGLTAWPAAGRRTARA